MPTTAQAIEKTPFKPLPKQLSIIVPTYKEVLNIPVLTRRIFEETRKAGIDAEVIFVDDDSADGSVEAVQLLSEEYPVRIIVRVNERGLSSAVLRGFDEAKYETLLVMDADLQHDPQYIPALVSPIFNGLVDFSVGSRHTEGGGIEDWPAHRKFISWGATLIARPLVSCSDPMSGYFALTKSTLKRAEVLNPLGYKIGLELMVRCDVEKIQEVPIIFRDRSQGESKLTLRTNLLYVLHVMQLYFDCKPKYFIIFTLMVAIVLTFFARRWMASSSSNISDTALDHEKTD